MKRIIQLFVISALFLVVTSTNLVAREVSGKLSAGEGSSFIPSQGSAFSIISDIRSGIYGGNFNIMIKSGGRIIYQEKSQLDDLYLVFNEPISSGDVIKLDVLKGVFIFKMSHMDTLPDVIVDAIKKQAPREYKQLKPLHNPRKKNRPVVQEVIQPKAEEIVEESEIYQAPVVNDSRIVKRHIQPEEYKREIQNYTPPKPVITQPKIVDVKEKEPQVRELPADISKPIARKNIKRPTEPKRDIGNLSSSIDSINKEIATVIKLQTKAIDSRISKSGIDSISKGKVETPKVAASGIKSLPTTKTFPMDIDKKPESVGRRNSLPNTQNRIESFSKTTPPTMGSGRAGAFQTKISNSTLSKPEFETKKPDLVVKKIKLQEKIVKPKVEVARTIPVPTYEPEVITYTQPKIVDPQPIQEIIEPEIVEKPIVIKEPVKDRIIITKTIAKPKKKKFKEEPRVIKRHVQPKEYANEPESIPQRMSDRVLGNGYGMATPGSIKVKAYSNNRPVSAWVEVFKADTKQRVKTFYTGSGKSLKDAKLPAGVYVIKATYRTAGSKRKKTVGKVTLEEGGVINKTISFDDGSVKVIVTKDGNPIYAKVEVFKSGKKRRVAYEFTSRTEGVAKLSLGSGDYDIIVKDHAKVRRFNSITVRGGKSRTLNADF